jgi:tetratricopeptide (TPR) repeat protein
LLVQAFRAGQLNLKTDVPPGLAQLANPYDPNAHSPYGLLDMSYYKGKLYLYFGITPALVLFWPYVALTGHYLPQKDAAVIFCLIGFLVGAGLLCALWRRYFAEVSVGVVAACTLALGLTPLTPFLLARCDVYEVAISCGYALTMLTLAGIWKALHEPRRRSWWLAAASLAYGLALGARPSLLFGAVILLVPVIQAWHERRQIGVLLFAATGPILLIGVGLMFYNALRFDSPFEFGWRYALSAYEPDAVRRFSIDHLWFNFRVYFLEPVRWGGRFPFLHRASLPPGHSSAELPFGVLTNIPLVWLALAVPLAWRNRSGWANLILRLLVAAVALLFGTCALTMGCFFSALRRYEVEFLSTLILLAVIGVLALERALACQPLRRRAIRLVWSLLLCFSVAFNLLASVERCAEAHCSLGNALRGAGQVQEAMLQYERALRLKPDFAEAHQNLGDALLELRKVPEAIAQYEQALRIKPDFSEAHSNLGLALFLMGDAKEAIAHCNQALRLKPDYAEAHCNLGSVLMEQGSPQEAIDHFEQALRLKPDFTLAHNNLGVTLMGLGRVQEAIGHFEQALRLKPDFVGAQENLARARAVQ